MTRFAKLLFDIVTRNILVHQICKISGKTCSLYRAFKNSEVIVDHDLLSKNDSFSESLSVNFSSWTAKRHIFFSVSPFCMNNLHVKFEVILQKLL